MTLGQLQGLGAIAGIPGPPRTKTRSLLAGLVALAKHTTAQGACHCSIGLGLGNLDTPAQASPFPRYPGADHRGGPGPSHSPLREPKHQNARSTRK